MFGLHNGTIHKYQPPHDKRDVDSDSQEFYRKIDSLGIDKAVEDAGCAAAFALNYVDISTATLNIIRNDKRPLYYLYDKHRTTMYWASEAIFLEFMRQREGIKEFERDIQPFIADRLYSITFGQMDMIDRPLVKTPTIVQQVRDHFKHTRKDNNKKKYYHNSADPTVEDEGTHRGNSVIPFISQAKKVEKVNFKEDMYLGYDDKPISCSDALNLLLKGCAVSGYKPNIFEKVMWISPIDFVTAGKCTKEWREAFLPAGALVFEGKIITKGAMN